MKKLIFLLVFILSFNAFGEKATRTLSVQGTSEVAVIPDTLTIRAMAETIDLSLTKASGKNNEIVRNAIANLIKSGISEKNISTENFTVSYSLERLSTKDPAVRKYFVRNQIKIVTDRLDKAGEVLSALEEAEINNIMGISYTTSKRKEYEEKSLILAYEDAKRKALALAAIEELNIIPLTISSNMYYPRGNYTIQAESKSTAVPIYNPQSIDIVGNISATFELKK